MDLLGSQKVAAVVAINESSTHPSGSQHNPVITPDVILAWIAQLLSAEVVTIVEGREGQIELRLYANRGKVRKHPQILLNSGPVEMIDP